MLDGSCTTAQPSTPSCTQTQQTLCVLPLACCAVKQVSSFNTASSSLLVTVHHGHSLCITAGRWHPKAAIWRTGGMWTHSQRMMQWTMSWKCPVTEGLRIYQWLADFYFWSLSITPDWDVGEVEEIKLRTCNTYLDLCRCVHKIS